MEYVAGGGAHQGELMPINAQFYYVNSDGQTIANHHRVIGHEEGEESNMYFVFCLAHLTSGNSSLGYVVFKFESIEEKLGWRCTHGNRSVRISHIEFPAKGADLPRLSGDLPLPLPAERQGQRRQHPGLGIREYLL